MNFENLTIRLHSFYIFNMHVKLCSNRMLFIIQSTNLFLCIILEYKNLKFKHLIDDIGIDFLIFLKFCKNGGYKKKKKIQFDG